MDSVVTGFWRRYRKRCAFRTNTLLSDFATLLRALANLQQPGFAGSIGRSFSAWANQRIGVHLRSLLSRAVRGEARNASNAPASNMPEPIADALQPSRK